MFLFFMCIYQYFSIFCFLELQIFVFLVFRSLKLCHLTLELLLVIICFTSASSTSIIASFVFLVSGTFLRISGYSPAFGEGFWGAWGLVVPVYKKPLAGPKLEGIAGYLGVVSCIKLSLNLHVYNMYRSRGSNASNKITIS